MMRHFFIIQYLAQPKRSRDDSGLTPYRFFKQDEAIAFPSKSAISRSRQLSKIYPFGPDPCLNAKARYVHSARFFFFIHDMPINFFARTVVRQIGSRIVHGAARSRRIIHHRQSQHVRPRRHRRIVFLKRRQKIPRLFRRNAITPHRFIAFRKSAVNSSRETKVVSGRFTSIYCKCP